jgi:transcriptional regulator with XRE-family HTH domain
VETVCYIRTMNTIRDTTTARIRELRQQRGMSQQGLARRLNLLGGRFERTTVAKIENGSRELTLLEAFQFAYALDVAPVHLFVPTDSNDPINIGPDLTATPAEVRAWIRGQYPLFQDARHYFTSVPDLEFDDAHDALRAWRKAVPIQVYTSDDEE